MISTENIYTLIEFDNYSLTPKYLQLCNCIIKAVQDGTISQDYLLPSINNLSYELEIGRNTVEKAYRYLKRFGFIKSVPGKGYFISCKEPQKSPSVCLIFNKLSVHKKIIYDTLTKALGFNAIVDLYIYNNDFSHFKHILEVKRDNYSHFVIIPHFVDGGNYADKIINSIPKDKLILMSQLVKGVSGKYGAVFEDFEKEIYNALSAALIRLRKYKSIQIIFPENTYHPEAILDGFAKFCNDHHFGHQIIRNIDKANLQSETVYICLMEDDLVILVKKILETGYKVGAEIGIISYNETPIKQIILNGITTISADFKFMGEMAAKFIKDGIKQHLAVPFYLTLRNSL
ncbi:regulatory protein, gntR family [Arachidicoccus rhizosphaerae]|jgi:DNA-binding transcriptional regulator YhcF (GntR family)|uniref:Regulatory protein, gntR family n=1 Tax=Arachidicoccus rhizosphaerae TaxID=551991 RepID=A0A1H3XIB3_9BACT|nr:substrate-binding domain-containing protein [Arachidicoccus rhizosphaerae]SDZ99053.1 regulatory protein, gntR family [Arachidicoccus rhizosphaerae]